MGQGGSRSQCTCFPLKVEEVGRRHLGTLCGRQNIILGNRELTQELRTNVPSKIKALNHHLVFYPVLTSLPYCSTRNAMQQQFFLEVVKLLLCKEGPPQV